jgi:hypothetical protein
MVMKLDMDVRQTWDGEPALAEERVSVVAMDDGDALVLEVSAPWHGDLLPDPPPGTVDGLWEYEVVEVFVAQADQPEVYTEIELGPGGHHRVLTFSSVRNVERSGLPIVFHAERSKALWRGSARIESADLPPRPWRINAFAIHGSGAARRYLVWHPVGGDRPDFHQPGRFPVWPSDGKLAVPSNPASVAGECEDG